MHSSVESDQNEASVWVNVSNSTESFISKVDDTEGRIKGFKLKACIYVEPDSSCDLFALICSDLNIKADKCMAGVHEMLISTVQLSVSAVRSPVTVAGRKTTVNLRKGSISFHKSSWCWSQSVWPSVSGPTTDCTLCLEPVIHTDQ